MGLALRDWAGSLLGLPPVYVPVAGDPGETAIGTGPDARLGERLITPQDGTVWHNRVTARSVLGFCWRRPVRRAGRITIPLLLVVPEQDTVAPTGPAARLARKARHGELQRVAGGHYDVYQGGASFEDTVNAETEFLHRHFG
jgi:pimeloyl-ACP methyl ester carboxylesterase